MRLFIASSSIGHIEIVIPPPPIHSTSTTPSICQISDTSALEAPSCYLSNKKKKIPEPFTVAGAAKILLFIFFRYFLFHQVWVKYNPHDAAELFF